jgi:metacaspase-1
MNEARERIHAVLAGIDTYERPEIPSLRGCVNDVVLVRRILKRYFGVPNDDIRVVVNARATKANILHRLDASIRRCRPGDVLVFYFSGHGSQIRDRDGDELSDALDEILCPYDMSWDDGKFIRDDDIAHVFEGVPAGVLVEAFFDCCFWGAGPRGVEAEPRPQALRADLRWLAPPLDIVARWEGDEPRLDYHALVDCARFGDTHVYWGASREGQTAAEDSFEGRTHGIFTYWACRFIEENVEAVGDWGYSREQLIDELREYLRSLAYGQYPELSAPDDLRAIAPFRLRVESGSWVEAGEPPG